MRRFIALLDAASVVLAAVLAVVFFGRFVEEISGIRPLPFAAGLLLGFLAADIASGVVHWFCDTYFRPETPVLGPMLIAPFREHHVDPSAMTRHGICERNGNNCLAASPVLYLAGIALVAARPDAMLDHAVAGFLSAASLTLCMTNQIHAWAHAVRVPRAVRALQNAGVLIGPGRHSKHHRGERTYAVVSGWSNVLLDPTLSRIEAAAARFGFRPDAGNP